MQTTLIKEMEVVVGSSTKQSNFRFPDFPDLSSIDWKGNYTIRNINLTGEVLAEGTLAKTADKKWFVFFLTPAETEELGVGKYFLSIRLSNIELEFPLSIEVVQCPLGIIKSGM